MKDLELLLPRVLEKAAACPEPTALRHLRDAAIEFCRRTRVWRATESFALSTDDDECVAVETGVSIFEISHAEYFAADAVTGDKGTPLDAVTLDWLDKNRPGWRIEEGAPCYITQSAPDTVRVVPRPEVLVPPAPGTLTLELILVPTQDAEQVPDVLIEHYSREIADGALGAVLLLPAEFGNAELGAFHKAEFEKALGRWSDRIPRGQQRARRRTTPSSFF
jgi:hypothetical protein